MARKKHAAPHEEHEGEPWLLPYSDLMTLLLALFIALFAISQTDQKKMADLAQAFLQPLIWAVLPSLIRLVRMWDGVRK